MSTTHIQYARLVRDHIFLRYGIRLKSKSLSYGSVKPDVSTIFAKFPHYIDKSISNTCGRVDILINDINNIEEIESKWFARELGAVLHYVADYFCSVHNDINGIKHDEGLRHIRYETKLNRHIKIPTLEVYREKTADLLDLELHKARMTSLCEYVKRRHRRYMKEAGKKYIVNNATRHFDIDLERSIEMVLIVSSYIIEESLIKIGKYIIEGEKDG
jgi:hypothetical protein